MSDPAKIAFLALLGLGVVFVTMRKAPAVYYPAEYPADMPPVTSAGFSWPWAWANDEYEIDPWLLDPTQATDDNYGYSAVTNYANNYPTYVITDPKMRAFIAMLIRAEGTARDGRDPYRTVYGYDHTIQSYADHPYATGEWNGKRLPDDYCKNAGFKPGCISTAAGAVQWTIATWRDASRLAGVRDFSPESQDLATAAFLNYIGAGAHIRAGNIPAAIEVASTRWASLPASKSGQPKYTVAQVMGFYNDALNTV